MLADDIAFAADDLARLQAGHQRFLDRLPQCAPDHPRGTMLAVVGGELQVTAFGHRIAVAHRAVFNDDRPWYIEYTFTARAAGEAITLMRLGLARDALYNVDRPGEVFVKVNSRKLCETLLGTLVDRLVASPVFAPSA